MRYVSPRPGRGLGSEFGTVALATLALEFALGIQRGVYPNFVADVLGIAPDQLGAVESIREIPGLLTVVLGAAAVFFRQSTFTALTLLVTAAGLGLYALTHTIWQLFLATVVVSIGFHLFYPVQSAMVLRIATPQERATRLGQVNSVTAAASLLAMGTVLFLTRGLGFCHYPTFFALAACAACAGALVLLVRRGDGGGRLRRPLVFRRAYMSYYLLTFLAGSRRHMYMTFAAFALVRIYHTPLTVMMTLIAGVLVPFLGGLLWAAWGPGATFLGGALLGLASLWYSGGLSTVQARIATAPPPTAPAPTAPAPTVPAPTASAPATSVVDTSPSGAPDGPVSFEGGSDSDDC